jgi:hypothetical protein
VRTRLIPLRQLGPYLYPADRDLIPRRLVVTDDPAAPTITIARAGADESVELTRADLAALTARRQRALARAFESAAAEDQRGAL